MRLFGLGQKRVRGKDALGRILDYILIFFEFLFFSFSML